MATETSNIAPARQYIVPVNIGGYINLINHFLGDESTPTVLEFFENVDEIGNLAGWTDAEKLVIARNRCKGLAQEYVREIYQNPDIKEYGSFKRNLTERFTISESLSLKLNKLVNCRQLSMETVRKYCARLESLAYKSWETFKEQETDEIRDQTLLAIFLAGLNPKIKRFVMSHCPQTYVDAKKRALIEEENENTLTITNKTVALAEVHNEVPNALEEIRKSLQDLRTDNKNSEEKFERELLRLEGLITKKEHPRRTTMRENYRPERLPEIRCFICNGPGHYAKNCRNAYMPPRQFDRQGRGMFQRERSERYRNAPDCQYTSQRNLGQTFPKTRWENPQNNKYKSEDLNL